MRKEFREEALYAFTLATSCWRTSKFFFDLKNTGLMLEARLMWKSAKSVRTASVSLKRSG
jgi:hypothetical protein